MKIAMIACGNGLGHLKRLIKICNELQTRAPSIKISLLCEDWQVNSLQNWNDFRLYREHNKGEIIAISVPIKWSSEQAYYGTWLCNWHKSIAAWQLDKYDQVVSDNLIEPILYTDKIILSGSFLWHDTLFAAFPDCRNILDYKEWAENIMLSRRPAMIANKYFAMPALSKQTDVFNVGIINFNQVSENIQINSTPKNILVAFGNASNANDIIEEVESAIPKLNKLGVTIFCPRQWYETFAKFDKNVVPYYFNDQNVVRADLAIVVGGLGSISDCIATRMPMLYIHNSNPELIYNLEKLSVIGIGMPLDSALQNSRSPLTDMNLYNTMINRCRELTLHGEADVADILLTQWREV
jgi:UDP-N-acetylglucosamine:LPS N-acetylglucosamine transferase